MSKHIFLHVLYELEFRENLGTPLCVFFLEFSPISQVLPLYELTK